MTRLESWASRKPCIALMGEFSAGKTTLTNLLVGEDVLPTRVTATQLPPVWMSYGEPQAWYVDTEGHRHDLGFEDLHTVPVDGVRYIRLFCKGRVLETIDLIDTPGISDPNIPKTVWEMAVGYVNAVLWCTHSTQAWRESERSAWESLPERLRENSVLLATRSDKLLPADKARVARRLKREAGEMFRSIIMFSAMDAIRAASEDDAQDLWVESGGEELLTALQDIAHDIIETRMGMLSRYAVISSETVQPSRVRPGRAVRPVRLEREESATRERLSRDNAASMRSQVIEGAESATPEVDTSEVLHLNFVQRVVPGEADAGGVFSLNEHLEDDVADTAELVPAVADEAPDEAEDASAPMVEQAVETEIGQDLDAEAGDQELEASADVQELPAEPVDEPLTDADTAQMEAVSVPEGDADFLGDGEGGEPVSTSVTLLWREVLASEPEARSVKDVLALFEKFLLAVDRAEGIEPDAERAEDTGLRKLG
ncbi:dynamin family protein [Defluviimonas sp. WL0002]|uniref:Dynamin family protein n=1 Tax=Albidovulum marisflavi TaxID=2984159 RepID=A0ABT2ZHV5_9RHOB|nr:dynamin family protein [Defluviimonas sp. WL0002]MCV2870607.1 dynamin family protein [Defluviimonas sp. WL0002]